MKKEKLSNPFKKIIFDRLRKDEKINNKALHKMIKDCPVFDQDFTNEEFTEDQIKELIKDEKEILISLMKFVDKVQDFRASFVSNIIDDISKNYKIDKK